MKLDRHNYEEYFILYLDNELDSESRRQVEDFARVNPDLKAELDLLLQSKLQPDTNIVFENKNSLLAANSSPINPSNFEEWLLSYTDNELNEEERNDVEKFAAANPDVLAELALLQKVKLQPEVIVFPYKESLYRNEEKARVISIRWWRMAAAAVLLLGISTTTVILININKKNVSTATVKNSKKENNPAKNTVTVGQQVNTTEQISHDSIANLNQPKNESIASKSKKTVSGNYKNSIAIEQKDDAKDRKVVLPVTQKDTGDSTGFVSIPKPRTNDLPTPTKENSFVQKEIAQNNSAAPVPKNDAALTKYKVTPQDPQPYYAVEQSSGNKGLRGLLRKVTRTFEKRTNIKATDDDDRLLIAGLAIKLN